MKIRLALATARAISSAMPNCAAKPARARRAEGEAEGLRNRTDHVDGLIPPRKVSTVLVPRMNITAMIGAEIDHRLPDGARRAAAFARQNRDILEAAERAHRHLSEDRRG